ncbi:MAG: N(4)-(beta-N-acetylglucosaminyl)-L-asparaginase [Planctomycetota bacterium]|nr:N(4)-(beta-N-acetylglucosaminyl)-L-asparaginase [Planctomycetota bacterium]
MDTTPIMVSTWSFGLVGHEAAWPALRDGGSSLDAVEEACRAIDADANIDSVGYGGLPDRDGEMSLDGCIMLSPSACGSVCAIKMFMHPVSVARRIMENTDHVMLAGAGADAFALEQGLKPASLLSDEAKKKWEQWQHEKEARGIDHDSKIFPPRPIDDGSGGPLFHDTIGILAIDANGVLSGACSTSGLPYKVPGRVGDSPIIGSGLYVHPSHGGATATGTGELVMGECNSFLVVELMRQGAAPDEAIRESLNRIREDNEIRETHQVGMIAMTPQGEWSAGALRDGYRVSITTPDRNEHVKPMFTLDD